MRTDPKLLQQARIARAAVQEQLQQVPAPGAFSGQLAAPRPRAFRFQRRLGRAVRPSRRTAGLHSHCLCHGIRADALPLRCARGVDVHARCHRSERLRRQATRRRSSVGTLKTRASVQRELCVHAERCTVLWWGC